MGSLISEGLIGLIFALITLVSSFFKTFKFVREGSLGLRLRFGKVVRDSSGNPKVINPGFVILVPWVESLAMRHVRQQTIRLENQRIILKDGLVYIISATILYKVTDVYKALFEIDSLDTSLVDFCQGILRDVSSLKTHGTISATEKVSAELLTKIKSQGEAWGVEFYKFKLVDNAPSPETANIVNVVIAAEMKSLALKKVASEMSIPISDLNSALGAILVGVPLISSISSDSAQITQSSLEEKK